MAVSTPKIYHYIITNENVNTEVFKKYISDFDKKLDKNKKQYNNYGQYE